MYKPLSNKLQLLREDDGTNSPMDHQLVISKLTTELGILHYHRRTLPLVPLPETPLAEGPGQAVPDLILYDPVAEETRVIIEICQNNGQRNDIRKIIHLIEDNDYGILEGFVYNYRTHQWHRYRKGDGGMATESSQSAVLNLDLNALL